MRKPTVIPNELFTYERKKRHWTQGDVADKISAPDERMIRRWERGEVAPTPHYRGKLAELFGKSARALGFPPDGQISFWHMPYRRNAFFTGREDIVHLLDDTFLAQHSSPVPRLPLALSGLGGVGKSQIALEYAYRYREHYHTILWLHAASYQDLVSDVITVADLLDLPGKYAANPAQLIEAFKEWLTQLTRWLLIFDNVENLQLLEGFLPAEVKGNLLLTTLSQNTGTHAHRIAVEPMDNNTGAELLLRRAKLIVIESTLENMAGADVAIARSLSENMGGLPLALDQAGAYVDETAVSLPEYEQRYQAQRHYLLNRRGSWVSEYSEHPISVAATLRLSFEKAFERHPLASAILHFSAFLQPDAIPEELFQYDDSFKVYISEFDEAIVALRCYSLISRNTQEATFSMHRLVQSVLIDTISPDIIRMQWRERVVRVLQAAFPVVVEFKYWRQCERLLPHALVCARWTKEELTPTLEVADLFKEAGIYLRQRGQYAEAETLHSKVHSICEQHFGVEHPYTAFALNNLALTYIDQGKYEQAEPLLKEAVSIQAKKFGAGHPNTILSLGNLAASYVGLGKYEQAEEIYLLVISIQKTQFGAEHPDFANNKCNLALLYSRQDKYEQAEPLLLQALSILEKQLEPAHPDIAAAQSNLAHVYFRQHKYEQAELLYQQAISIQVEHLGTLLPQVARNLYDLSLALYFQGKEAQAEAAWHRYVNIHEQQVAAKDSRIELTERNHTDFLHSLELAVLEGAAEAKAREANDEPSG